MGNRKIGDVVKVIDSGRSYTTYDTWFKKFEPKMLRGYKFHKCLKNGDVGTVVAIHEHTTGLYDGLICAISINENIFLIHENGIALKRKYKKGGGTDGQDALEEVN